MYVGQAALRTQLWLLRAARRRGVDMTTVARQLEAGGGGRLVGITFDDAYRDILHNALPVLLDAGFTATCYAVSARLGMYNTWDADVLRTRKPLMSAAELREWAAAGMEVGAQTRTHARLTQCTAAQLDEEVARSPYSLPLRVLTSYEDRRR